MGDIRSFDAADGATGITPSLTKDSASNSDRILRVLHSLTLEDKCLLLSGKNMWETHDIPRLGIQSLKTSDGPAGVRGATWTDGTHTTFIPCGIALAATFDPALVQRVGKVLGSEARSKGAHVLLAPTMNISRSPFGGRNFENFGEDPFLTGTHATAYIAGVQDDGNGVGACMKHFVANDMETRRFNMDETISERTLREIYLKPFHMVAVQSETPPWTAMTSYPKINGKHADTSRELVHDILREEWGFDGLVMSDWGGLNSTVDSIHATTDLEMPGPPLRYGTVLAQAVRRGEVSESKLIDPAVIRLLRLLDRCSLLPGDDKPGDSVSLSSCSSSTEKSEAETDTPEFRQTARETAANSVVLLKNENNILPLKPEKLQTLAIIGPNAKHPTLGGTGSAVVNPYYTTNPFDSLSETAKIGNPKIEITYEPGILTSLQPPLMGHCLTRPDSGDPGFQVDFYAGHAFSGPVVATTYWHDSLVYCMSDGDVPTELVGQPYSYRATGRLRPSVTGAYNISLSSTGKAKLFINDTLAIDNTDWTTISGNFMNCGSEERLAIVELTAGKTYSVRVDNVAVPPPTPPHDNTLFHRISGVRVGLLYRYDEAAMFAAAVNTARTADAVVLVVGHNNDTEREGSDRTSLSLPGRTDALIAAICSVNSNVVVVTQSACAISMPWVQDPQAIVQAWYQGQECGNAVADVLFGAVNPSGKLPLTFPKRIEDHGSHKWFPGNAVTDKAEYGEGVLVGYRWFDARGIEPLWPFGYGLSYSSFSVSGIAVDGTVTHETSAVVKATVTNTSAVVGSEVVQVYLSPSPAIAAAGLDAAPKALAGFTKVRLSAGESKRVEITLQEDAFAWWDTRRNGWRVDKGIYKAFLGTSSRHIVEEVDVHVA
ncbi:hypothetical protein SBRCBS47491_002830 [Sporothrix bragantina]|uniref:beta-glucosidase n=1 Tax=Sporothrix bragantina TaxID=671064 RepID=A0ABP0BB81_9PEZI